MTGSTTSAFADAIRDRAQLTDAYDARDLSEVVFRSMRDLMSTEVADRITEDLARSEGAGEAFIALWKDTNPVTSWLSRVRRPLIYDDDTFLFRVRQEGGLQKGKDETAVVNAVFSVLKPNLSSESVTAIADALPGKVKQMWNQA